MAEIKIILDALSQSATLDQSLVQLREMVELLNQIKGTKNALKFTADVNEVSRLTAKISQLEAQINSLRSTKAKEKEQQDQTIGTYRLASRELTKLNNAYRDLVINQKQNTAEGQALLAQLTALRQRIVAADTAVGIHTRNVGNYTASINTLGRGLGGLTGLLATVGSALGFNTGAILDITNVSRELIRTTGQLSKVQILSRTATIGNTVATEANTVATAVNSTETKTLSIAQQGYALVVGQSTGAMKAFRLALAATGIGALIVLLGTAVGLFLSFSKSTETAADKVGRLKKELEEQIRQGQINNETLEEYKKASAKAAEEQKSFEDAVGDSNEELARQKKLLEEIAELGREKLTTEDIATRITTGIGVANITTVELTNALQELKKQQETFTLDKARKDFEDFNATRGESIELTKEEADALPHLDVSLDGFTQRAKEDNEERKKTITLLEKELKLRSGEIKVQEKITDKSAKAQEKADKDEREKARKQAFAKFAEFKEEQKNIKDAEDLRAEAVREAKRIEDEEEKARRGKAKKQRKDDEEQQKKAIIEFTNLVIKEVEKQSKAREDALNKQVDDQESAIERQQELADKGLANTLAFEERKKDELQRAAIEEQENQERLKKVEAFFNAFAEFSKDDKPEEAVTKALLQVALAEAVSATFAEGGVVEDVVSRKGVGGGISNGIFYGRSHAQGGVVIEAQGQEGIFSVNEMQNLGRDNFYNLKSMLKAPIDDEIFARQSGNLMQYVQIPTRSKEDNVLARKMDELKQAIIDKKETTVDWNKAGDMIIKTVEKGVEKVTIRKRRSF